MQTMREVVDQVPEDIGQVAQASLHADKPIRDALRDVLEHRLWIQKHGERASQRELDTACAAIDRAYRRLSDELQALARSEERRVGKECVSQCRSRWSP